jgi:hypothetical protein
MIDRPLYHWLLGDAARRLPPVIYRMHATAPRVVAVGTGTVTRGTNVVTRFLADLHRMPAAGRDRPLTVTFEAAEDCERIMRSYPDTTLVTHQSAGGPAGSFLLAERFGPFALSIRLSADEEGIDFALIAVRWHGMRLPRPAWPRLQASERADGEIYRFHVRIDLPLLGRLIEYRGTLQIAG